MLKEPIKRVVKTKKLTNFWYPRRVIMNTSLYEISMIIVLVGVIKVGGDVIGGGD